MNPVGRLLALLVSATLASGASCHRPIRSGSILDAYRAAACVVPTFVKDVERPTRSWDATIDIAGGSQATVRGANMVGGRITIRFEPAGRDVVAVRPGDYIYPKDVRLNDQRDRLYVKASGLAGGIWDQTWLYEYDLVKRRQLRRSRVHADALPSECVMQAK